MRQVLSISLPEPTIQTIKNKAAARGFNTVSNYIKYLLGLDEDLISAEELLADVKKAEKEYAAGKTIKANSIAELL